MPVKKIALFDIAQITALAIAAIYSVAMYFLIRAFGIAVTRIAYSLCFALLFLRIANHQYIQKDFDPAKQLPFHLCSYCVALCFIAAMTKSPALLSIAFGIAPAAGALALLFPEDKAAKYPRLRFRSIEYYFSHINLVVMPVYTWRLLGFAPQFSILPIFIIVYATMLLIAWAVNKVTGGNYMYIMRAPHSAPLELVQKLFGLVGYRLIVLVGACSLFGVTYGVAALFAKFLKA
ncbi:MAG: YwaF family protein [Eubacteriaceae bacterium]|nr:YwaF family protein [Eubacteriaceae bacterium]